MNLVQRVINIITKPKEEWEVISKEESSIKQLITNYLVLIALVPAIALFIRYSFFNSLFGHYGGFSITAGFLQAIATYIAYVGTVILTAIIIDALAPSFKSEKNMVKSFQLAVFALTPFLLAGIFKILPVLGLLSIAGLYGIYLMYLGLGPLKKTPEENKVGYLVVIALISIVAFFLLSLIFGVIIGLFTIGAYAF